MNTHPTSLIHPNAQLAPSVTVGPYSVIGGHVTVGEDTVIGAHCVIEGRTTIGKQCRIFTGAVIGSPPQDLKYSGEETQLTIGDNNLIREYVTINPGTVSGGALTSVGSNNLFMAYAHIAHDCHIGSHCVIANVGTLGGHVTMEDRVIIGGLAAIHQFVRIGTMSIIGGCSKVVQDIPPYATCDGHPACVRGLNAEGLKRAQMSDDRRLLLKRAYKILYRSKLTIKHAVERVQQELPVSEEITHLVEFIQNSKRGMCR